MRNQVTNGFDRMAVSELLVKANFIISEMTANVASFPAPVPALSEVQTAVDELQTATLAAENRDRVAIVKRANKRDTLIVLLRRLGVYVNLMANSDRAVAMRSGFDVAKEGTPRPPITYVEAPMVSLGANHGEFVSKVRSVEGARAYQFFISSDAQSPLTQWATYSSTQTKFNFKGLESATRYYIRVAALGVNNQCVYSDASTFVTQ